MKQAALEVLGLKLKVCLGWPKQERSRPQTVLLDIHFKFHTPPHACQSDDLGETLCYATLSTELQRFLRGKRFKLIEHLAFHIYSFIKEKLHAKTKLCVRLHKKPASLKKILATGVVFVYGDWVIQ